MSFWKSFFGAMAAAEISEKKRTEREQQNADKKQLNDEIRVLHLEQDFLDYLRSINCVNVSDFDEAISAKSSPGDTWQTKRVIENCKEKLKEYMRLGGDPSYITEFAKMDLYIEIVRKLKEYDWLDKQEQYVKYADDTYFLDFDWKQEQKERHKKDVLIPKLLNHPDNELNRVSESFECGFISFECEHDAIAVDSAYYFDETTPEFSYFLKVSVVFSNQHIIIYNCDHDKMYYKADVSWKNVEFVSFLGNNGICEIEVNGIRLLIDEEYTQEIDNMYLLHNINLEEHNQKQRSIAYDNINSLTGIEFERLCKRLLENMGFSVETTKTTGDGGIDLIAYNKQPLLSGKYIIQCKRYTGSVGEPIIRDLYGVITSERANKGILMTSGVFTKQACLFAEGKPIELIDGVKLRDLLKAYYN